MESGEERMQRAIEVSHGSVGEFSKSAASQSYIQHKRLRICLLACLVILCLAVAIILPIFWFCSVPIVSVFLQKSRNIRVPVVVVVEIAMSAGILLCIACIVKRARSVQRRVSYLESCSGEFTISADHSSLAANRSDSLRSSKKSSSSVYNVALRQILEDLPRETVEKIQKLAQLYLNSGTGRSKILPGKFPPGLHKPSNHSAAADNQTYKLSAKVLLIGDVNVGKTSVFHRILYDQFSDSYLQTLGVDLGFSTLYLSNLDEGDELSVALQIWDIGGQEQLAKVTKTYLKDSVIIIPVVDISNKSSLLALNWWFDEISDKVYDPCVVMLLNKADLGEKLIQKEDIDSIEKLKGIERYEVSAKTGANVMKAFTETVAKVIIKEAAKIL